MTRPAAAKIAFLGTIAISAVVLAQPAAASASNWKDKGSEIAQEATIPITGTFAFEGELGGVSCPESHGKLVLKPGSTGTVTIEPTVAKCKTKGPISQCSIETIALENQPWTVDDQGTLISITNLKMIFKFSGFFCPGLVTIQGSAGTATPDSTIAIASLSLGGTLKAGFLKDVAISGTFTPSKESDIGTYGL